MSPVRSLPQGGMIHRTATSASPARTSTTQLLNASTSLDQSLVQHRVGDFGKSGNVSAVHVIARSAIFLGRVSTGSVNRFHDVEQTRVDFFARPTNPHAVLRHFQS